MTSASNQLQWTVSDLDGLPEDGSRYEIIDGELQVTRAPHWEHQDAAGAIYSELRYWSKKNQQGQAIFAPGVIFSETSAVIPDVVWVSAERLNALIDEAGHLSGAPDLVIEVLSQSQQDKARDRTAKRKLYSLQGVTEYWILDRELRAVEIYRRSAGVLERALTLYVDDRLTSPLLPGFSCKVGELFG
ncbi:MAG: Uma2 family endonuclease [Leptolyngbya sp. SIO4C1]|nr:Uma2 family endonuclease [Leptolyngbya sp. SIO4C1]